MKKFLLTLVGIFIFGISSEIFAQNITRYSDYGEDWTLDKQLFDLGDASIDLDTYKTNTFKVAILSGSTCQTGGNFAEYGENFQGLGRIEISSNNETEATYWKFKPGKKFAKLNNEDFVEFCYGTGTNLDSRIKIKKSSKGDVLKMVGVGEQQKVVLSKSVGDFGSDVEVSLRCEPNDIDYNSIKTGENDEKFVISLKKLDLKVNNSSIKAIVEDGQDTSVEDSDVNESFNTYFFVKANNFNVNFEYVINSNNTSISNTDTSTSDTDISNDPNISPSVSQSNLITSTLSSLDIFLTNHPDFLEMYLYKGTLSKYEDIFDTENHPLVAQGKGLALSTNLDITDVDSYSLVSKIRGSVSSPNIKVYSFSKLKFDAKLYLDDFLITIEGNGEIDVKDSKNTFFTVQSDKVNAIFSFKPEDISDGTNAARIIAEPGLLSLSLYKGIIDDVANIPQENLISKTNGLNLSANLDIKSQDGENFSFVAKIGTEYIIKVYSISRYGAKIISSEVFPTLAKAGSQVKFTITANIYNALSDIDYAQIIFDDDRFENLNLKLKESQDSGSGSNMGKEVVFEGNYNLPSDDKINGQFIGYKTFVILKDGTRTELNGKKEIYVGTRKDICKDPKTCVLRGLKALRKTNKTSFDKIIIENFNKNDFDFTEDDLYKIFRKQ